MAVRIIKPNHVVIHNLHSYTVMAKLARDPVRGGSDSKLSCKETKGDADFPRLVVGVLSQYSVVFPQWTVVRTDALEAHASSRWTLLILAGAELQTAAKGSFESVLLPIASSSVKVLEAGRLMATHVRTLWLKCRVRLMRQSQVS
jgi:hypothetical protein